MFNVMTSCKFALLLASLCAILATNMLADGRTKDKRLSSNLCTGPGCVDRHKVARGAIGTLIIQGQEAVILLLFQNNYTVMRNV